MFLNTGSNKKDTAIAYFSGLELEYMMLVVPAKSTAFCLVPAMEYAYVKTRAHVPVKVLKERPSIFLEKYAKGFARIGINKAVVSLQEFNVLKKLKKKWVDVDKIVSSLQKTKTKEEVQLIQTASTIADDILRKMQENFVFATELEVAEFLLSETRKRGCEPAFPPIVGSGKNSAFVHYHPQNIPLQPGFLLIDFGVKYRGYCSDITRMFYRGKPTPQELKDYQRVFSAQQQAIDTLQLGKMMVDIDMVARKQLGKLFCHGLGHGIGTEVHELPTLGPRSTARIEKEMVFTIEPGIYFSGKYGIRIEDTVLMKEKPVCLTQFPKQLCFLKGK